MASPWDGFAVRRGWYGPVGEHGRRVRRTAGVHRDAGSRLRIARRMARIEDRVRQRKKWNAGG